MIHCLFLILWLSILFLWSCEHPLSFSDLVNIHCHFLILWTSIVFVWSYEHTLSLVPANGVVQLCQLLHWRRVFIISSNNVDEDTLGAAVFSTIESNANFTVTSYVNKVDLSPSISAIEAIFTKVKKEARSRLIAIRLTPVTHSSDRGREVSYGHWWKGSRWLRDRERLQEVDRLARVRCGRYEQVKIEIGRERERMKGLWPWHFCR